MRKMAVCFSRPGMELIKRLNAEAVKHGIEPAEAYVCTGAAGEGFISFGGSVSEWAELADSRGACAIFVSAAGIAVRAVAGICRDKLTDIPVIVIDDNGRFVIPIMSGHAGGGNKIAVILAELLGAVPVITTSTDVNGAFSADVYAKEQGLRIENRSGIRKVSAKAIEGKPVTLSFKHYPPQEPVDIIVADETDREYDLLLKPKRYVLGIGARKGKDPAEAEAFILNVLRENGVETGDVYAVCTIDIKKDEEAIKAFCAKYRIPLLCFDAELLSDAEGEFEVSEFVKEKTGVDNVCQRAAALGAGPGGRDITGKIKGAGITAALFMRKV
ncbi:MAG: cobalamin biosynthesis protein [Lachnospiraceae bacterium]|nr:cobalamin biosynthesis protein [Lachnospiraceae bacterium]